MKKIFATFLILFATTFNAWAKIPNTPISLTVKTIDGEIFDLSKTRGKPVIVVFWVSWCNICHQEMLVLNSIHQKNKNVEILALNFDENDEEDDFLKMLKALKPSYKIAKFSDAKNNSLPRPAALPMTYILDKNGVIQKEFSVTNLDTIEQDLEKALSSLK